PEAPRRAVLPRGTAMNLSWAPNVGDRPARFSALCTGSSESTSAARDRPHTAPMLALRGPLVASAAVAMSARAKLVLRPASIADVDAIAALSHSGWIDGHVGRVP